jgi:hypothetical protein
MNHNKIKKDKIMKLLNSLVALSILFLFTSNLSAQESYNLEYKFEKGKTFLFKDVSASNITQEMMGKEMKIKAESNSITRIVVDDVKKDGSAELMVSADSMKVFSSTPMGDTSIIMKDIIGKRTKITTSKFGKPENREIIDSIKLTGRAAGASQRESIRFPQLAGKSIKIGENWTATTTDSVNEMGGTIVVNGTYDYKLVGKEKKNGTECLKITFSGKTATEGKASIQGMEFFIDGSGKTNGTFFFDPKAGIVVSEETDIDNETNMATSGEQSMIIPITQATKSVRTLIK